MLKPGHRNYCILRRLFSIRENADVSLSLSSYSAVRSQQQFLDFCVSSVNLKKRFSFSEDETHSFYDLEGTATSRDQHGGLPVVYGLLALRNVEFVNLLHILPLEDRFVG